jgi:membrane protease YdiL (CAAX protease family)
MVVSSVAMQVSSLPWDFWLILLVLATAVPWRGAVRVRMLLARPQLSSAERISLYGSTIGFQWLAAGIIVWRAGARGLTPAALGLSSGRPALAIILGAVMAAGLASMQIVSLRQLSRLPLEKRGHLYQVAARLMPQTLTEALVFVALVGTVSLCEELMFRGFAFAAFKQLSGSTAFAVIGSSALFALGHLYQGRRGVANTFALGLLFAGARSWSASLLPPIMSHLAVDLVAGLVGRQARGGGPGARESAQPASSVLWLI